MWGGFLPAACCHAMSEPGGEKDWRLSACAHGDKCLTGRHFVGPERTGGGRRCRVDCPPVREVRGRKQTAMKQQKKQRKGSGHVAKLAEEKKGGAQDMNR